MKFENTHLMNFQTKIGNRAKERACMTMCTSTSQDDARMMIVTTHAGLGKVFTTRHACYVASYLR